MQTRQSRQQMVSQTHDPMKQQVSAPLGRATHPTALIQRTMANLGALTPTDVLQLQRTIGNRAVGRLLAQATQRQSTQKTQNKTGLPDSLKSGIEALSGISMDNVKVHYDSSQPAQRNALAYAQGADIYVAPGQEQYLKHEAWHVVQQAQGLVKPTMQTKDGVPVNDDPGLEQEADVMGIRALKIGSETHGPLEKSNYQQPFLRKMTLGNHPRQIQRVLGQRRTAELINYTHPGEIFSIDFEINHVPVTFNAQSSCGNS